MKFVRTISLVTIRVLEPSLEHGKHRDLAGFASEWIVRVAAILITVLHLYAVWSPSAKNWGFHFLAFLTPEVAVFTSGLLLAMVFPSAQNLFLNRLDQFVTFLKSQTQSVSQVFAECKSTCSSDRPLLDSP